MRPSKRVLMVSIDPPPDYHSLLLFACTGMQAKTESAVGLPDWNTLLSSDSSLALLIHIHLLLKPDAHLELLIYSENNSPG